MENIKDLVKKHFNLVEAAAEQSFGEIKTADGELTLTYEGEELAQGLAVFVVTADGQVPAPDGEHALEGGITIVTADGKIEAITETAPAEEVEAAEHEDEEEMQLPGEEMPETPEEAISEEVVAAVAEAVAEQVSEMMKKYEEKMAELEAKFDSFASAPANEKTIASKFNKSVVKENYRNAADIERLIARKRN
jgi:hypothetical protein